jgi:hypothetical protein
MSRELEAFLTAEDLDDLLGARHRLGRVGKRDSQAAVAVLEQWADRQAVANLLFYPDLLPRSLRMRFLMKGLDETEVPYYQLAAVMGLQTLASEADTRLEEAFEEEFGPEATIDEDNWKGMGARVAAVRDRALGPERREERKAVCERLLEIIDRADEVMRAWDAAATGLTTGDEVLADRASAILLDYVEPEGAARLVPFLDHPSACVQNNVLFTLLYLLGTNEVERLVVAAAAAGQASPAATELVRHKMNEPLTMHWAYIPSLVEASPTEGGGAST